MRRSLRPLGALITNVVGYWRERVLSQRRRNAEVNVTIVVICAILVTDLVLLFYFLALRPRRRRRHAQQEVLATVKKGDEIVTIEGLFGTVRRVGDTAVVLEIADRKTVRVLKHGRLASTEWTGGSHPLKPVRRSTLRRVQKVGWPVSLDAQREICADRRGLGHHRRQAGGDQLDPATEPIKRDN